MLQGMMPWLRFAATISAAALLSTTRPVEILLLTLGVFLLAYFGIPGFREFVSANQGICFTAVTTVILATAGVRPGIIGMIFAIIALGVGAYIIAENL
jgi:hypothetical protein